MSIAAPIVVLFCVLAVGGWVAASLDSLTFALISRPPLSPATVALPWRRGARDLLPQCLRTDRPDLMNSTEEHTSELQSLLRTSYAVICLNNKKQSPPHIQNDSI